MPSEEVQRHWTGDHGRALLRLSSAFVRSVERGFFRHCDRPLRGASILDYGCGWGRIMRLMYRYSDPELIHGVDPDAEALEICRATRVLGHLAQCDHVPHDVPFPGVAFDLVYAFSVLTHLSERTAKAVLGAIRDRIEPDGLLIVTIRPIEYWSVARIPPTAAHEVRAQHRARGFAFLPFRLEPIGEEITYGEASIDVDYIRRNWGRGGEYRR